MWEGKRPGKCDGELMRHRTHAVSQKVWLQSSCFEKAFRGDICLQLLIAPHGHCQAISNFQSFNFRWVSKRKVFRWHPVSKWKVVSWILNPSTSVPFMNWYQTRNIKWFKRLQNTDFGSWEQRFWLLLSPYYLSCFTFWEYQDLKWNGILPPFTSFWWEKSLCPSN